MIKADDIVDTSELVLHLGWIPFLVNRNGAVSGMKKKIWMKNNSHNIYTQ
jgi:hypothetical protein